LILTEMLEGKERSTAGSGSVSSQIQLNQGD